MTAAFRNTISACDNDAGAHADEAPASASTSFLPTVNMVMAPTRFRDHCGVKMNRYRFSLVPPAPIAASANATKQISPTAFNNWLSGAESAASSLNMPMFSVLERRLGPSLAVASPKVWRKWNVHSKPNSQLHHRHCVGKLGDGDGSLLRANRKVLKAECETHEKVLNFLPARNRSDPDRCRHCRPCIRFRDAAASAVWWARSS